MAIEPVNQITLYRDHFIRKSKEVVEYYENIHASVDGLSLAIFAIDTFNKGGMLKAIADAQGGDKIYKQLIETTDKIQIIKESNYLFLFNQAVVVIHSILESTIKDFIIDFFKHCDKASIEKLSKVKLTLGEFASYEENQLYSVVFDRYEQDVRNPKTHNKFEDLLKPLHMAGEVDYNITKALTELRHTRNTIVHNSSICDHKYIDKYPDLGYKVGDQILTDREKLREYVNAVLEYFLVIGKRIQPSGNEVLKESIKTIEKIKSDLK